MSMSNMSKMYSQQKGASKSTCAIECNRCIHLDEYPITGFYSKSANMFSTVNSLFLNFLFDIDA